MPRKGSPMRFDPYEQDLAINAPDDQIYPYLKFYKQAIYAKDHKKDDLCVDIHVSPADLDGDYDKRAEVLPFTRRDVQKLIDDGSELYEGRWSVLWSNQAPGIEDRVHRDDFRSVFVYKTIELMIRPVSKGEGPKRLHIGSKDITRCLRAALEANPDPSQQMSTVMGRGMAKNPDGSKKKPKPDVPFQWRLDRAHPNKVVKEVEAWRSRRYPAHMEKHYREKRARESGRTTRPDQGSSSGHKRSAGSDSPSEAGPSYKRRSTESQPHAMGGPQYPSQGASSSWYMPPPPVPSTSALSQGFSTMALTPSGYPQPQQQQFPPGPLPPPQGGSGPSYASSSGPTYTQLGMSDAQLDQMERQTRAEIEQGRGQYPPPQQPYQDYYQGGYPPSSS